MYISENKYYIYTHKYIYIDVKRGVCSKAGKQLKEAEILLQTLDMQARSVGIYIFTCVKRMCVCVCVCIYILFPC